MRECETMQLKKNIKTLFLLFPNGGKSNLQLKQIVFEFSVKRLLGHSFSNYFFGESVVTLQRASYRTLEVYLWTFKKKRDVKDSIQSFWVSRDFLLEVTSAAVRTADGRHGDDADDWHGDGRHADDQDADGQAAVGRTAEV